MSRFDLSDEEYLRSLRQYKSLDQIEIWVNRPRAIRRERCTLQAGALVVTPRGFGLVTWVGASIRTGEQVLDLWPLPRWDERGEKPDYFAADVVHACAAPILEAWPATTRSRRRCSQGAPWLAAIDCLREAYPANKFTPAIWVQAPMPVWGINWLGALQVRMAASMGPGRLLSKDSELWSSPTQLPDWVIRPWPDALGGVTPEGCVVVPAPTTDELPKLLAFERDRAREIE